MKSMNLRNLRKFQRAVYAVVLLCAIFLLTSCSIVDHKSDFIRDFALDIEEDQLAFETLYNDYGDGFFGEGFALYKITPAPEAEAIFRSWPTLPLSQEAENFIDSLSSYIEFPSIAAGHYQFVNRTPSISDHVMNASLCVYDSEAGIAYLLLMDI